MKNLKYLLSISLIITSFSFAEDEEEVRTMEKMVLYIISIIHRYILPLLIMKFQKHPMIWMVHQN